jgi:DNA-directed RNA polymerase specialized sigma24 family protein
VDEVVSFGFSIGAHRSDGLSTAEVSHLVDQALGSLNTKQQTAITLVYFQGLTLEEAAQKTGETPAAIRHHYYRGLMKLREFISSKQSVHKAESSTAEQVSLEVAHLKPRPI